MTVIAPLTTTHVAEVSRVHVAAFPESAITRLGREAAARYYRWLLEGPHQSVSLGAFDGNQLTGFCFAGVFSGALTGFLRRNRAFLAWRVATRPWLAWSPLFRDRLRTAARALRPRRPAPPPKLVPTTSRPFGVLAIATDPRYQGRGVGRALMTRAEAEAVRRGFIELGLTVHPANTQAIRFYEGLGWVRHSYSEVWYGAMRKRLIDP